MNYELWHPNMGTFQISNIPASKVLTVSIFSFIDKSPNMLQSGMILHILYVEIDQEVFLSSWHRNLWKYHFVLRALQPCSNFHVVKFHHNGCMEIAFIAIFPQIFTSYFLSPEFLYFLVRFVFIQNSPAATALPFHTAQLLIFPPSLSVCLSKYTEIL